MGCIHSDEPKPRPGSRPQPAKGAPNVTVVSTPATAPVPMSQPIYTSPPPVAYGPPPGHYGPPPPQYGQPMPMYYQPPPQVTVVTAPSAPAATSHSHGYSGGAVAAGAGIGLLGGMMLAEGMHHHHGYYDHGYGYGGGGGGNTYITENTTVYETDNRREDYDTFNDYGNSGGGYDSYGGGGGGDW